MKTSGKIAATLAAAALALTACGSSDDSGDGEESSTVKLGIVNLPIFAPVYVADAKGYFEDEGLDVRLQTVQSGADAVPLTSSGQLDAAAVGFSAGMFSALDEGLKFKVVGSMGIADGDENAPTDLVVGSDSGISSLEDLQGKKIGAAGGEGGTGAYLTALALETAGLSLDDVELVNLGNPDLPAALKNGSLDAALISAPFSHNAIKDGSGESYWVPPKGTSGTGLIYGEKFTSTETAQKFFNALARAAKDLQGEDRYSDENIEIIAKATDQTPEQVRATPLYTWDPNLAPLPDQLAKMEQVWMGVGALTYDAPLDPADYLDESFAKNAAK